MGRFKLDKINSKQILFLVLGLIILSFFLFYPKKYITIDEHNYVANAYRIINGTLEQKCDLENVPGQFVVLDHCIYKYNIGASIIYAPFVLIKENLVFLASFLSFIFSILIFYKILELLNINKRLIFLFALYPSFLFISRTALSENFSMLFILISTYLVLLLEKQPVNFSKKYLILLGLSIGSAVLIRYTNIIPLSILLISFFATKIDLTPQHLKRITQNALLIALGALPFLLLFFYINLNLYGGLFRSGYYYSKEEIFTLYYFIKHLPSYILVLSIIYPLMLPISLANKKYLRFNLMFLSTLFLYSASKNTLFESEISDLVKAVRFLIPVLPLLMLSYFDFIDRKVLNSKYSGKLLLTAFIALLIGLFTLSLVHQRFLNNNEVNWPNLQYITAK